ncbi:MAG: hypothetical protein MI861_11060, partial [Pirellulales bacterium]|nr:hypothetical protein [Pirellulales bacterium]
EMKLYDKLVNDAEQQLQFLKKEGLADNDGNLFNNDHQQVIWKKHRLVLRENGKYHKSRDLEEYEFRINKVRLQASEVLQKFIYPNGDSAIKLPEKVCNDLIRLDIESASLDKLKVLFGPKPTGHSDGDNQVNGTGVRQQVFDLLPRAHTNADNELPEPNDSIVIRNVEPEDDVRNVEPVKRRYDVTMEDLEEMLNEMKPDEHLQMDRRNNLLYAKSASPHSQSHAGPRWFESGSSSKNRNVKFREAKRAVRDALATHLGSNPMANKIMKRISRPNSGLSRAQLKEVIDYVKVRTRIDEQLQKLANQKRLSEINSVTAQGLLNVWTEDQGRDEISDMLLGYAEGHQPAAAPSAYKFAKLAAILRRPKNSRDSKKYVKKLQEKLPGILKNTVGLSPRARAGLKQLINPDAKSRSSSARKNLMQDLASELDRCALGLTRKILTGFRNDLDFGPFICSHELEHALDQVDKDELGKMSPATLSPNSKSKTKLAFDAFCRFKGQNESHVAHLARFSSQVLAAYLIRRPQKGGGNEEALWSQLQEHAKHLVDLDPKVQWDSDSQKSALNGRTPMQVLKQLAGGKKVTQREMQLLANSIDKFVEKEIQEFRQY